jgi:hypothetical protein
MEDELVYCNWVNANVKRDQLGEFCDEFIVDNKCIKCGSHNVDCDWGTPTWCNDCGHEWG